MKYGFAWLTALLIACPLSGREVQTVHIRNGNGQGSGVLCGGTHDGSKRVILSVAHVCGTRPGATMIATIAGRQYEATLVGGERQSDAALLTINGMHLEDIPSASLWMGAIEPSQEIRTEGFSGRRFVETYGRPRNRQGRQLVWTSASFPGMSGGPTYLSGHDPPVFLTTTTASDHRSVSIGPYRTWFTEWIPTLTTSEFNFTCSSGGSILMSPRGGGRIEGPIAIPEPLTGQARLRIAPRAPT